VNKVIIAAVVLVLVFLAGFVPQYAKVNHLGAELRQAQLVNASAELRDLVGLAYFQANQKNYGIAAGTVPWFVALSLTVSFMSSLASASIVLAPPVVVCDPAFVAEMPGSGGVVLKIGHFDEVGGVTHVEK